MFVVRQREGSVLAQRWARRVARTTVVRSTRPCGIAGQAAGVGEREVNDDEHGQTEAGDVGSDGDGRVSSGELCGLWRGDKRSHSVPRWTGNEEAAENGRAVRRPMGDDAGYDEDTSRSGRLCASGRLAWGGCRGGRMVVRGEVGGWRAGGRGLEV